ncbi:rod shape-determining protein MreC [Gracilinema caldarium]|uniref:Cell shape-determining protein MreC n=1 Tax=Gracilinema caldarium (strain ATCC 51460 / DSM 7334 / H1) TaxID=744872 RepID=F8F3F8_GRAC1|nr:rod shape-determining protein MreC [Gracilinema caldarium]AEJ19534.1 rod shape-determining protein MreC [Gracilinema caldarium DSM 7334]
MNGPNPKRSNNTLYVFIALVTVSFSCLLFSTRSFVIDVRDVGFSLFSGFRGAIHGITLYVQKTILSIEELRRLKQEYDQLTKQLERYEQLARSAADIEQENINLKKQLNFSQNITYKHIPAQIIGKDPDNLFTSFVIDKGIKEGIKKNMAVIAFQDGIQGLVGLVVQVGRHESMVLPVYDANSFVSARFTPSLYEGIVSGQGDVTSPLIMKYIKKRAKDEIQYGDRVITSGLGGIFPKGIEIGRVSRIIFQEYETSLTVELESSIDFSRLEYVFVIERSNTGADNE